MGPSTSGASGVTASELVVEGEVTWRVHVLLRHRLLL